MQKNNLRKYRRNVEPKPKNQPIRNLQHGVWQIEKKDHYGAGVGTILTWAVPGVSLNLAANFGKMAELERFKKSCLREINILAWESSESEMKKRL